MKTAVCISGQCRTLNQTHENIRQNLLEQIGDYDLFMYVPKDEHSHHAHLLNHTVLKIADDRHIDEGDLINGINCRFKTGVQSYLQQLYALKLCGQLRLSYEQENGFVYDCIIRCRPDIFMGLIQGSTLTRNTYGCFHIYGNLWTAIFSGIKNRRL